MTYGIIGLGLLVVGVFLLLQASGRMDSDEEVAVSEDEAEGRSINTMVGWVFVGCSVIFFSIFAANWLKG